MCRGLLEYVDATTSSRGGSARSPGTSPEGFVSPFNMSLEICEAGRELGHPLLHIGRFQHRWLTTFGPSSGSGCTRLMNKSMYLGHGDLGSSHLREIDTPLRGNFCCRGHER